MTRIDLDWHGRRVEAVIAEGAADGAEAAAKLLLELANRRVPLETGALLESGRVTTDETGTAAVSYADENAVRQHEDPYYEHDPGRSRKYLEIPMLTQRDAMLREVAEEIRARVGD